MNYIEAPQNDWTLGHPDIDSMKNKIVTLSFILGK